jgi:hypothetical protein
MVPILVLTAPLSAGDGPAFAEVSGEFLEGTAGRFDDVGVPAQVLGPVAGNRGEEDLTA